MATLIVALDFAEKKQAMELLTKLDPDVCAVKIGSEMFSHYGAPFVREVQALGFRIFLDLKFHDIPNTVAKASLALAELDIWMFTVHAAGGSAMLEAARRALETAGGKRPIMVAVTVLTSLNELILREIGVEEPLSEQVIRLSKLAKKAGADGVVSSAFEVPCIKKSCGEDFLTVTPGIRLPDDLSNDQIRIVTPTEACQLGSDYLVIGRSITMARYPQQVVDAIISSLK